MSVTTSFKKFAICALIVPTLLSTPVLAGNASFLTRQQGWNANANPGALNRNRAVQNSPFVQPVPRKPRFVANSPVKPQWGARSQSSVGVTQTGNGNAVTVTQTGVNNSVNVVQVGQGSNITAIQSGSGNVLVIYSQ